MKLSYKEWMEVKSKAIGLLDETYPGLWCKVETAYEQFHKYHHQDIIDPTNRFHGFIVFRKHDVFMFAFDNREWKVFQRYVKAIEEKGE